MFRILAITATLIGITTAAQADVYRWTDAKGTVQYSDRWVPGSTLVKTDKPRSPEQTSAPAPAAPSGAERADQVLTEQRDKETVAQDVAKSKAEQCTKAREDYEKGVASRRVFKEGKDGTRDYMSDAEADAYRLQLLEIRKRACGS
jgi:hypothetical protein